MKKRIKGRTLSRNASQRLALKRTMLVSLVNSKSIKTTLAKAKELKPFAERIITRAKKVKKDDVNSLAVVIRKLKKDVPTKTAKKLISIAKQYDKRNGGYLSIIKLTPRKSDTAEMAILQWVSNEVSDDKKSKVVDDEKKDGKNMVNMVSEKNSSKKQDSKKKSNNKKKIQNQKSGKSDK